MSIASNVSVSELVPLRQQLADALSNLDKLLGSSGGAVTGKSGRPKKEKKASKRAGRPTVLGDFTKKVLAEHADEVKAYKEANPEKKGAHLSWVSEYKKAHADEWAAFEAAWKEAHPKEEVSVGDSASEGAPEVEASDAASAAGSSLSNEKPKRVLSEEHKAKMKAGREAAKAKKDAEKAAGEQAAKDGAAPAPAPVTAAAAEKPKKQPKKAKKADAPAPAPAPAPVVEAAKAEEPEEEPETELLAFTLGKVKYLRPGVRRADGNHLWASGDLWESVKGAKGDYAGCLQDDGSIDASAEEPDLE